MQITFFSILMCVVWSGIFAVTLIILRKSARILNCIGISNLLIMYLFCIFRLMLPVEYVPVKVINMALILNPVYDFWSLRALPYLNIEPVYIFLCIWIVIAVLILVIQIFRYSRFRAAVTEIIVNGKRINGAEFGISDNRVNIILSKVADYPFTFGIVSGFIIIPDKDYCEKELGLIIRHEYTHYQNNDLRLLLVINILCAMFWWNPFIYIIRNSLGQCFEIRCDRCVTADIGYKKTADYLNLILKAYIDGERVGYGVNTWQQVGLFGIRKDREYYIKERFRIVENTAGRTMKMMHKSIVLIVSAVVLIVSYSFIFQTKYDPPTIGDNTPDNHEITPESAYIIETSDGQYILYDSVDESNEELSEKMLQMMVESGFKVYKEELLK